MTKPHSHNRDDTAICVAKVKAAMKDKAKVSRETPAQIFASAVANTSDDIRAEIGKKESLKRNIRNAQRGGAESLVDYFDSTYVTGSFRRIQ